MAWVYNLLIVNIVAIIIVLFIMRLRRNLLKLWKDVTSKEVIFHKLLLETTNLFYENKKELATEETTPLLRKLSRYRKKKLRQLLLKERQDLFTMLDVIQSEVEEQLPDQFLIIQKAFEELQKARRIYNTKVLLYNQTISVFPTRFLAIKMNLHLKEYFV